MTRLRFAYADPPYVGQDKRGYYDHPDTIRSAPSLGVLLPGAPEGTRIGAWVKPFAAYKRNVRVAYTWEPVLFHRIAPRRPGEPVGRDHLAAGITLRRGFTGAKPESFASWLAVLLGWKVGDDLVDLFPGSGAVGEWYDRLRLDL